MVLGFTLAVPILGAAFMSSFAQGSLLVAATVAWCILLAGSQAAPWLAAAEERRRARRLMDATPSAPTIHGTADGAAVRVTGTVLAGPTFESAVSGRPVVLARYRVRGARVVEETRGIDFPTALDRVERTLLLVRVRGARVVDEPFGSFLPSKRDIASRWHSPWARCQEMVIAPGDRIEVAGVLDREVDPAGQGESSRGPPLRAVLRAGEGTPLLVRKAP